MEELGSTWAAVSFGLLGVDNFQAMLAVSENPTANSLSCTADLPVQMLRINHEARLSMLLCIQSCEKNNSCCLRGEAYTQ